jgi:hypothetical protein
LYNRLFWDWGKEKWLFVGKMTIGKNEYGSKKAAIAHYRSILNSYEFGQPLNDADFSDLIDLLNYFPCSENEIQEEPAENPVYISEIKVSRVQFNKKCFEVFYDDGVSYYISYLMLLNGKSYSKEELFYAACRSAVWADIHAVKSRYFKGCGSSAVCQETGVLSRWEELVIDHRQPNTFSVIIDRFKELYQIEPETLKYETDSKNNLVFADAALSDKFREYHRAKANLRIVRRECNSSRSGLARVKRTNKDLTINN